MTDLIERHTLAIGDDYELRYSVFRGEISSAQVSPLLICLHPGWTDEFPPIHYGAQFLSSIFVPAFADTGATIVSPDCPGGAWNNPESRQAILKLIDHFIDHFAIDQTQISLVGYSAGGWGVWYLLQEDADRFSSAIIFATLPVIDPVNRLNENLPKCRELLASRLYEWLGRVPEFPVYIIHSLDDELLPYADANRAYQALVGHRSQVRFETVRGIGHFEGGSYVEALHEAVPWLIDTWSTHELT
jgi:pimeloyl-ACP methyl ester carboxylesterase